MPRPNDIYARLARDYAKPRQYSGYSSGEVTAPAPADAFGDYDFVPTTNDFY